MNDEKCLQRQIAYAARNSQPDKEQVSQLIGRRLIAQPWWQSATTVMLYMHCKSEVRTTWVLMQALGQGRRVVVPYCTRDALGQRQLGLWRLESPVELQPGMWGILEPPPSRWLEQDRQVGPQELDVVMTPGVAFDKMGGRLGNGAGYYDRLLAGVRRDTVLAGICYEAQLLPTISMAVHDVYMDFVVTEQDVYPGCQRSGL